MHSENKNQSILLSQDQYSILESSGFKYTLILMILRFDHLKRDGKNIKGFNLLALKNIFLKRDTDWLSTMFCY